MMEHGFLAAQLSDNKEHARYAWSEKGDLRREVNLANHFRRALHGF